MQSGGGGKDKQERSVKEDDGNELHIKVRKADSTPYFAPHQLRIERFNLNETQPT
jgi:hypothetical protein